MGMRAGLLVLLIVWAAPLDARVLRTEISSRSELLGGKGFGKTGSYERVVGRMYFRVRVADPHNTGIVDLERAENLRQGEVEFAADFLAIRPKDPGKSNGTLLLEIPNRGKARIIALVDGGDWNVSQDAGDAWLLRSGYTIAALGWQWDATGPDVLRLYAPVARENSPIRGLLRGDIMPSRHMQDIPLGHFITGNIGGTEYPVSDPADAHNVLTVRGSREAQRVTIPRSAWQFAHVTEKGLVSSNKFIYLNGGFEPGRIYEYVYAVANPAIAGLGLAAVRDFASYAKHDPGAIIAAKRVIAEGISQNGRFLRDFLYEGFNADEGGRPALDGVLAHVAGAGRGSFNYRFAQPSRDAQPTSSVFFPTDVFPFTDLPETDAVTGARSGLLDRANAEHVVPKIFFSNTSYEYWGRAASLIHVSPDGKRDVAISPNVRIYHFTGLQHFSGSFPATKGTGDLQGQQPQSPLPVKFFWRAMVTNMDSWLRSNTEPPPSTYPRISDGTLVPLADYGFPQIPGVHAPREANTAYHLDYGPDWQRGILRLQPPKVGAGFPVFVPQVNVDGNERDGVRLPEITVPLATYTGWNFRARAIGAPDQRVSFEGSYLPFPKTAAERKALHDPRESIAERYAGRADYLARYRRAVEALARQRWILAEDCATLLERGGKEWDEATR
jgi:Alpha/beta hydrolase domain